MMNSVRDFIKNFKKYLIYIAVLAQLVFGTVYLVCNFSEYIIYPETEEMVHAARTLVFDEYIGFLYPLFIRVCLNIQNLCGVGYYLIVHGVQLSAMFLAVYYMIQPFFGRKKAWLVGTYVMSVPMCMQTALMVSPFAFKAIFSFLIAGSMVRIWKDAKTIKGWIILLGIWAVSAFNVPDDLFVWGVPILGLSLIVIFRKSDKLHIRKRCCIFLAVLVVFLGAFGTVKGVTEPGSRGRMHKTVGSVLFQRTLWPDLGMKYGFLPLDIQVCFEPNTAFSSDRSAETITNIIGPKVEREYGVESANDLFMEAFKNQLSYNKKTLSYAIVNDFSGYLLPPYMIIVYMQGIEGSALGSLYNIISNNNPEMLYVYLNIFLVTLFVLTILTVLQLIKSKEMLKRGKSKGAISIIGILVYQALWYAIVNIQGVDYRYVLLNVVIIAATILGVSVKGYIRT